MKTTAKLSLELPDYTDNADIGVINSNMSKIDAAFSSIPDEVKDGEDGVSPTVTTTAVEGGTKVTITDVNGEHAFTVKDGSDGAKGAKGDIGEKGDKGDTGADGKAGKDGISPTATVEQTADGATITITDANGTTTTQITNGADGEDGKQGPQGPQGEQGADGNDGFSPTVSTEEIIGGTRVTITDAEGAHEFTVANGADGAKGEPGNDGNDGANGNDGFSPTVATTAVDGGTQVTITDANGGHTFVIKDGEKGEKGEKGDASTGESYFYSYKPSELVGAIGDGNSLITFPVTNGDGALDEIIAYFKQSFASSLDGASGITNVSAGGVDDDVYFTYTKIDNDEAYFEGTSETLGLTFRLYGTNTQNSVIESAREDIRYISLRRYLGYSVVDLESLYRAGDTLKGNKGDKGDPGDDYVLTAQDKSDIAALVAAQFTDGDTQSY